jgi:hypothetical protein
MKARIFAVLLVLCGLFVANSKVALAQLESDNIYFSVFEKPGTYGQVLVEVQGFLQKRQPTSVVFTSSDPIIDWMPYCEVETYKVACVVHLYEDGYTWEAVAVNLISPTTEICVHQDFADSTFVERCKTFTNAQATETPIATEEVTPTVTVTVTVEPTSTVTVEPTQEATPEPTQETATPEITSTIEPTDESTPESTPVPTTEPTALPTEEVIPLPTAEPTATVTVEPTDEVTPQPTAEETITVDPIKEPTEESTPESTPVLTTEPTVEIPVDKTVAPQPTEEPTTEIPVETPVIITPVVTTTPVVTPKEPTALDEALKQPHPKFETWLTALYR